MLARLGIALDLAMNMAGFHPWGDGELQAHIPGGAFPGPLQLTKRWPLRGLLRGHHPVP